MLTHELLRDEGILILRPQGPLQAGDFTSLATVVDPYLEEHGTLRGIMVDAQSFPGWDSFAALVSHLEFVRDHHRLIGKIAPQIAKHFVKVYRSKALGKVLGMDSCLRGGSVKFDS